MDILTQTAIKATLHCLLGCAIGEVLGMVIGVGVGASGVATVALSIVLAFIFGYALSLMSLMRAGMVFAVALPIVLAADTLSILTMEIVDNLIMVAIPGAMSAGLGNWLFWASLAFSLLVAFVVTVPVNRWLIARGKGHALVHQHHQSSDHSHDHGHDHHHHH